MTSEQSQYIRSQFPILNKEINGQKLCYLDNAATTQKPQTIIDAISYYYENYNSNIHRGIHTLSNQSTILWENSHRVVAEFLGARTWQEVFFVKNTTEGINAIAMALGLDHIKKNDVIAVSEMEHHSNILPWRLVAEKTGAKLEWIPVTEDYSLDIDYIDFLMRKYKERLKVVAITHVSNVLGVKNDIKEIAKKVHSVGAYLFVDGAQSVPHVPINVVDLDCDFFVFSGHKVFMPTGTGVVYAKSEILEKLEPSLRGGGMIADVTKNNQSWEEIPWKFEAGTPDISGGITMAVGFLWLVDLLKKLGGENVENQSPQNYFERLLKYEVDPLKMTVGVEKGFEILMNHEKDLMSQLISKLSSITGLSIFGDEKAENHHGALSFTIENVHPHDVASLLDEKGIAIRAGMHCAHPLHRRFGLEASSRVSLAMYNTAEDVERVVEALKTLIVEFR